MSGSRDPIRVLHIDDEPELLELTATYLEREGGRFAIETATSADDGVDCLTNQEFDCIISDYDLPGMNGIDFLRAVREEHPDLPFILFTGKGSEEVASDAISAGVTDYLQKQRGTEQYELLANRVTNAVEQQRARTHAEKHRRVSSVVRDINQALVQATSREEIDHRVCQILTDADPYVFAWIGTVDPETGRIEPQAAAGLDRSYLDDITVTVDDSPTGRGPGGTAFQENRVAVSQNIDQDEAFARWREDALDRGYRAVAAIPLTHDDTQYGLLGVYADRTGAFDEDEQALLAELGDTIAHAYHRLDLQREYQDQYRELFEEAPVMFTFTREVNGEPIIEDCNQLFAETLGYPRDELRGTRLADVYTEESAQALLSGGGYDRALSGEFVREQRQFVTSDGDIVTTLLRATPRRNADGDVIGTHALFIDITDQTRLQTLEQLRERVEFALDATDSVLFELDVDSGEETRHGPFERLYGIDTEAVETSDEFFEQCVHPEDREKLRQMEQPDELAGTDGRIAYDFRTHPDRDVERWIHFEGYVSTASDGTPERLIGIDTDITERKARETQLKQEQQRFETLFTQLTQPLVEVEYNGHTPIVTDVNPAFEEQFGYDATTIVGESLDAYIVPEDRQAEADDINRYVREGGKLTSREVTRQTVDGLREFLLENAAYEDGTGGFAVYTDITERKRREEALDRLHNATQAFMNAETKQAVADKAVETARTVLDQPITGLWLYNPDEDVLEPTAMTDEAVALLGEQPTYTGGESLSWQAFQEGTLRSYADVRTEPDRVNPETPIRSEIIVPLGEYGVMNISATEAESFSEIDLSLARLFGQTVEAALERAEREEQLAQMERIVQEMDDGVVVVQDANITYTNPEVSEIIGYEADELLGEPMGKFIAPEDRETVRQRYRERLAGNEPPKNYEITLLTKSGDRVPVEITAAQVRYRGDPATVSILRDISERKHRIKELRRQNERLDRFTSVVTHDLQNPLHVAFGEIELAQEDCDSDHLATASEALERMETLIDDLLTIAREGQRVTDPDVVRLADTIQDCWKGVKTSDADLVTETDQIIQADASRLKQVFENLIRNAVAHGGETVTVRIGDLDDGFYVADDGPGIPPDEREEVFEVGYSTTEEGTGFGLNIVQEIIEAHGWEVEVTESETGGACFEITGVTIVDCSDHDRGR